MPPGSAYSRRHAQEALVKAPSVLPRYSARGAAVLLPPRDTWPAFDAIRERYDPQIVRWMPHIPLLFPFRAPEDFEGCLPALARVCQGFGPLTLTLGEVRFTLRDSGRGTLWVACEPEAQVTELRACLAVEFPELSRKQGGSEPWVPLIVVGQTRTHLSAQRIAQELHADWSPLQVPISAVTLVGRGHQGPFEVLHEVPLGGGRN